MRLTATAFALYLCATAAPATEFSCPQVKLIVPYAAAGATDVISRIVADHLSVRLKRTVYVENRPGATGNIGTAVAIAAAPDGCTLLINAAVIATFPASFSKLKYDPFEDLAPVGGIGITPTVLLASPSLFASDVKSLVELSKQRFDGVTYSVAGYGLQQHLVVEQIKQRTGANFLIVPYKGGRAAMADLVAARVDFGSFLAGTVRALVQEHKLKSLAVVQDKRSALLPNVPTTAEEGFPGLNGGVQFLMFASAATPKEIVEMLSDDLRIVISDPGLKQQFLDAGFEPTPMSPEEVAAAMHQAADLLSPLIKKLNIKLD